MENQWILFCPQLPAIPSSPRVTIWRKMRSVGGIGLDNGLWVLLFTDENARFVREIQDYVTNQGGTSKTFISRAFDEDTETGIRERFLQDRAEEYAELKEQCADFLVEIEKETQRKNFSFAEYEENEQDLNKLKTWYDRIRQRDFLGGENADQAAEWLSKCIEVFQSFSEDVFSNEDQDHTRKMQFDPGKINDWTNVDHQ